MSIRLIGGDCREVLATLPADSVHCVVTSPPYYGLRDYGVVGQIGLEATPDAYLAEMVRVFREVRRVLRPDGTCWVNMGDSYASTPSGSFDKGGRGSGALEGGGFRSNKAFSTIGSGAKAKDLLMMPARLALALQADGWWLRSDIIWHKPNPMPESVTDRPTSAHEHVFLLAKAARYFFDHDAIREPVSPNNDLRGIRVPLMDGYNGDRARNGPTQATRVYESIKGAACRNVWTIATAPYSEAHFATFPPALAERCIRAGTKPGDTVLDPFAGAGTTLLVADRLQRDAIGIELSPDYTRMAMDRCRDDAPLFAEPSPPPAEPPEEPRIRDLFA
jgi:DNA modification methylase